MSALAARIENQFIALDQCAMYKLRSKARLAELLHSTPKALDGVLSGTGYYAVHTLPERTCPFTKTRTSKRRSIQAPTKPIRRLHERILMLLQRVQPPLYAHGAIKGKSYLTNAMAHLGASRVATFDIRKFYASTTQSRVFEFFASQLHCANDIAALLAQLICCENGLPMGSPLSPLMSLYANRPMFEQLQELANEFNLHFTCYFDDLTFSGSQIPARLVALVQRVARRYGHALNEGSTRLYRSDQAKLITGVVLSDKGVTAPNRRFQRARLMATAIEENDPVEARQRLMTRLAGVRGEVSMIVRFNRPV